MTPNEALASNDPRVADLLAEHKLDNDEVLPHMFMGDVTLYAGDLVREGVVDGAELTQILTPIERAVTSGVADLEEPVVASFLENVHLTGDAYADMARRLGPQSRHEVSVADGES